MRAIQPKIPIADRVEMRKQTQMLFLRAQHLPERQRFAYLSHLDGTPITQIARHLGTDTTKLRRSIQRTRRRLTSRLFTFVMNHVDRLPQDVAVVARLFALEGRPIREIASLTRQPIHVVRKHITTLKEVVRWHER